MMLPDPLRRAATVLGFGLMGAGAFLLAGVQLGQALHVSNATLDAWWRLGAPGTYMLAGGAFILALFALTFNLAPGMSGWFLAGTGLLLAAILAAYALPGGAYLAALFAGAALLVALWPSWPARIAAIVVLGGALLVNFGSLDEASALLLRLVPALALPLAFSLAAWTGARAPAAKRTL